MRKLLIASAAVAVVLMIPIVVRQSLSRANDRDSAPAAYVLDSLLRAGQSDNPPHPAERAASLHAAKGSREAFQIVIYGGDPGVPALDVTLERPFSKSDSSTLPLEAVALYREHYVAIQTASYHGTGGAKPGVYPDALIPFRNRFTGEPLSAGAFEAKPSQNQAVYVEVAVPADAAAGTYESSISITSAGHPFAEIPVTLAVWDFAIPRNPSFHSAFQDYDSEHLIGPARYYGYPQDSPEHRSLEVAMDQVLLENRIVPEAPEYSYFKVDDRGHIVESPEESRRLTALFSRPERSDIKLLFVQHQPFADPLHADRDRAITYLRDAYAWFEKRNLLDKVWLRTHDEPHTYNEFKQTLAFADLIHEANPNWRVAITGGFDHSGFEKYLFGHLNIFMMCFDTFDPSKTSGADFWSYTALVQAPSNPSPYWQIDFPLLNYRIAPWINYRYGLHGLLYWTTAYWNEIRARGHSPWNDACSVAVHDQCFNGDGMLVYPGQEIGYTIPRGAYGDLSSEPVYGPVASLRLKALRDGMQDYELLALAAKKDPRAAMDAAISVGCRGDAVQNCFHSWNTDPGALLRTRLRLAEIIQGSGI